MQIKLRGIEDCFGATPKPDTRDACATNFGILPPADQRTVAPIGGLRLRSLVSAREIISEIQRLPPTEQAEVIQFAYRLDAERMLSGKELGELAQRMINTTDPMEKVRIRGELTRGFYGGNSDA